ncbi:MAG: hypothetical protein ACT4PS_11985 [Betaproteobacteria bacterium]
MKVAESLHGSVGTAAAAVIAAHVVGSVAMTLFGIASWHWLVLR